MSMSCVIFLLKPLCLQICTTICFTSRYSVNHLRATVITSPLHVASVNNPLRGTICLGHLLCCGGGGGYKAKAPLSSWDRLYYTCRGGGTVNDHTLWRLLGMVQRCKLFQALECAMLPMVQCATASLWRHSIMSMPCPDAGRPSVTILRQCAAVLDSFLPLGCLHSIIGGLTGIWHALSLSQVGQCECNQLEFN